jgi:acetolactate synthase-1/2/3 large subunit
VQNESVPLTRKLRGGLLVGKTLAEKKVDCVFTLSGGFINPILEGLNLYQIRVVNAPHEQIAGHLADGMSRLTRVPAVCLAGPEGMGNVVPAMLEAYGARSPVVFITGSSTLKRRGQGGFKEIDHVRVAEAVTKWSVLVTDGNRIPDFIDKAFEIALSGNPGPVHLSIPTDLLYSSYDEREERAERPFKHDSPGERLAWPDPAGVEHLDMLFRRARHPVIVAGSGVWWGRAERELADFASRQGIPILVVPYHQHLFAEECSAYCGLADVHQYPPAEYALQNADLVVTLGCRLDNMLNFGSPPLLPARALLACVDSSADDAGANHAADWRLLGHPRQVLAQLTASANTNPWAVPKAWMEENRQKRAGWINSLKELMQREAALRPMHPLFVSMAVIDALGADDYLVIDGGDTHYWAEMALNMAAYEGKFLAGVFHPGPMSLLGCGVAFGLAIKMKHPNSNVVVLSGDGAFLCSGLSIETAFNEGLPITVVVDNNRGLGSIAQQQMRVWESGTSYGTSFRDIPFDGLFKGMGGYGETVEAPDEIIAALKRAIASGIPACVNVKSRSVISPLVAALTDRRAKASIE